MFCVALISLPPIYHLPTLGGGTTLGVHVFLEFVLQSSSVCVPHGVVFSLSLSLSSTAGNFIWKYVILISLCRRVGGLGPNICTKTCHTG